MTDSLQAVAAHAKEILGPALVDARTDRGELTLEVRREDIVTVCRALRDDPEASDGERRNATAEIARMAGR